MSIALERDTRPIEPREFLYTRERFDALVIAGAFDRQRVQLIRGRLIEMPRIGDAHGVSSLRVGRALRRIFPEEAFTVRPALPFIAADESEPEPDLCVVSGPVEAHSRHPSSCLLLIEVSESTLRFDRETKGALYAESGVRDYWIVNLVDRVLEVYHNPHRPTAGAWAFDAPTVLRSSDTVAPLARPGFEVSVAELLP